MSFAIAWLAVSALAGSDQEHCPGLSFDQRPAVDIPNFVEQVSTRGNLDDVLADKLNVALLTSGCFAVRPLGRSDLPFEPRYRVQGTITEYLDEPRDGLLVLNGERMKLWRARLTVLLQVTDIESGQILATETFEVRTKTSKKRTGSVSQAMLRAQDNAVAEIAAFLAPYRTRMVAGVPAGAPADG